MALPIRVRQIEKPPSAAKIGRNLDFGVALGLTKTAKDGQKASQGALRGTFTIRNRWLEQGNKFGIKVKAATKADLTSEVRTNADWIIPHETGKDKTARGGRVAVPTANVRRSKRDIITKPNRPSALRNKRTFVIKTKRGDVLYQRKYKGKRSFITPLYGLERRVRIRKVAVFEKPIETAVKRRLGINIEAGLRRAFATMR
jgi:hypothetical protein